MEEELTKGDFSEERVIELEGLIKTGHSRRPRNKLYFKTRTFLEAVSLTN